MKDVVRHPNASANPRISVRGRLQRTSGGVVLLSARGPQRAKQEATKKACAPELTSGWYDVMSSSSSPEKA